MTNKRKIRFVTALCRGAIALRTETGLFQIDGEKNPLNLESKTVQNLISDGVLLLTGNTCSATVLARNWLKRQLAVTGNYSEQHKDVRSVPGGSAHLNINEGPLLKLSYARRGMPPFLQAHHLLAARKIETLVARTQMLQRTTMSYDPTRTGQGSKSSGLGADLGDSALDARKKLRHCLDRLPPDCAGVVMDVCGFQKGLQLIETERRWPRRSAKLILRIGLDQLCALFELAPTITGVESNTARHWMDNGARPKSFRSRSLGEK